MERELVDYAPSPGACGVGACTCIVPTLGDPRETSLTGIDRIKVARPPWTVGRPRPRIKKNPFLAPSTCPIDLFGPLANRTVLKRLHGAVCSCLLVSYKPLARLRRRLSSGSQSHYRSPRLIAGITSTGQSHTYWPEAHRAHTVHTDISCAARRPSSSSAHGCSNKFVGTRTPAADVFSLH